MGPEVKMNIIFREDEPKYRQLYFYLRREIEEGKIQANEKLPSKRMLARQLGVSLNTVELAFEQLMAEGYLYGIQRKGYYVSSMLNVVKEIDVPDSTSLSPLEEKTYRYSFSLSGVEEEGFPFATLRKIHGSVLSQYQDEFLLGGERKGILQLRERIAAYLREARGFSPHPESIIISSGTDSLLQLIFLLLGEEGLALEDPGFQLLHTLCHDLGKDVFPLGLDQEGILPEDLRKTGCNLVFITPSHQFPSGLVYPVARRLELLSWALEAKERYIIEDDYDSEFRYTVNPLPSLKSLDRGDKVIYLGSFSKSLSPAFKLSYLVLPEALLEAFDQLTYWACPVSLSTQLTLAHFVGDGHYTRHLNRMRKIYKEKREILVDSILMEDPNAVLGGSDAGLFLTLRPSIPLSEETLVMKAKKKGIFLYAMGEFSLAKREEEPVLVLGFSSIKKEDIPLGINELYSSWRS